ncbi:MAG: protease pro-enzyme activation domain-containing protein [Verrucomicrobiia bacterium]
MSENTPVWRVGRALFLALVFGNATTSPVFAQRQVLSGHVPPIIKELNLQPVARLAATNILHLTIGLPLQNQAALGALLQQLYDPASPNYRHYLTPAQFAERFGPAPADYQALIDFAKANGLRITGTHPNRVVLDVEGAVADIERALQVTLSEYQHPQEARTFYAPDAEPSLDLAVPVLHIAGLDNFSLPHPNLRVGPAAPAAHVVPQAGSEGGEYIGNDFRAAYVPGSPLTGTGQSVALLEYDGYFASDITHYETLAKLPAVTLTNILINGGPITPGPGDGEVSLDIEMAISMATNLTQILVYEGTNGVTSWATILNQIADDDLANQVSCSWSGGAADPSASQVFEQMAAQGQSFFNAAGDSDAFTGGIPFPSDDTNITIVGGTTLSTTNPSGSYVSETVWNWCVEFGKDYCSPRSFQCRNCQGPTGSSGGVSTSYSIPPWQQGISMTANQGSTTMRNVPDVALTADHVFVAYGNGLTNWFGGTSCATPLWAAFTALVNQQAAAHGLGPVGFLNPALYAIGQGANYTNCFHDITTGNNEWTGSETKYTAVTSYDLCTGWGTPTGTNLINALSGSAVAPALLGVSPASYNFGTLATGTTAQATFAVTNSGGASLSGTASVGLPFAVVTNGSFSLAGFASTNVVVQFAPVITGSWTSNVVFTSTGGSSTSAVSGISLTPGSIAVTPATLNFGALATGTTAQASFVVTNSGGIAVSNGTATVSGGPFTIVSGAAFRVSGLGSTNVVVQFAPVTAGGFTNSVVFTTANGGNATNTVTGAGAVAPVASFTAAPTNGIAPLSVTFTDTSTGSITNWSWNFGDGGTANLATNAVVYAYDTAGVYTVSEIVTGPGGSSTNTQPNYIVVLTPFQGWQIQYFHSTNNPSAVPGVDADGTGQNNLFKFVAGLDPTNPASVFLLNIISDTNQPNAQDLQFLPMVGGRTYTPQFNTDLVNGVWLPLATYTGPVTNGNQISVTDTNPLPPQEFYRISISLP